MKLVNPTIFMRSAYFDFIYDWAKHGEIITPNTAIFTQKSYFAWLMEEYKLRQRIYAGGKGLVPASTYFFMDASEQIIGAVNIRKYLSPELLHCGGHIGYGIRPSQRRRGYASEMLRMALLICRKCSMKQVLITCLKNNIASSRTIIKNGGILENEIFYQESCIQRYWIDLSGEK